MAFSAEEILEEFVEAARTKCDRGLLHDELVEAYARRRREQKKLAELTWRAKPSTKVHRAAYMRALRRKAKRREQNRRSRRTYRQTEAGKERHRRDERARYQRNKAKRLEGGSNV